MGTWGTGIYGNDTAEEVREFCNEIFPFVSVEEGNRIVFREFKDILEDVAKLREILVDNKKLKQIIKNQTVYKKIVLQFQKRVAT